MLNEGQNSHENLNQKLSVGSSLIEVRGLITSEEIRKKYGLDEMVGYDQKSDFHALTLDKHTEEIVNNLKHDELVALSSDKKLILLAGMLHDIGKLSDEGRQISKKDSSKIQYAGHENVSKEIAEGILKENFDLSDRDRNFVLNLIGVHASAMNMMQNFAENNQPTGNNLKSYDKFLSEVEGLYDDKVKAMKLVLALNKADKMACVNDDSDENDPKVRGIKSRIQKEQEIFVELDKALPALVKAIEARRGDKVKGIPGDQTAGITKNNDGVYEYKKVEKKEIAISGKELGLIMKNFVELGLDNKEKSNFIGILKNEGVAGLGVAGYGKYIGKIKKLLNDQK